MHTATSPASGIPSPSAAQPLLARAMASIANAIFMTDHTGAIIWANEAFVRLSGYSLDEIISHTPAILRSGRQSADFYAQLWQTIQAGRVWQGELVDRRKDGSLYVVDEIITPLLNEQGSITHFIAIQHDITDRKQETELARHLAFHDALTDLPNRAHFLGLQQQAIAQASRNNCKLAILFLDLDKFKPINDALGHHIGDQLLSAVAERMRVAMRQTDTVARIGGDEFAILIGNLEDTEVAIRLAQKLIETLSRPFVLRGHEIYISASVGIAFYPTDGTEPEALLIHADQAMYRAKCDGGNGYRLYDSSFSK